MSLLPFRSILLLPLATALLCALLNTAHAQTKAEPASSAAPFCDQQRALLLIQQQVAETKTFERPVPRIAVLVRAADLLWPYQPEGARAIFTEAFDLASAHFREHGDETRQEGTGMGGRGLTVQLPDQRFVVLQAIARRDAAWGQTLAAALAAEETRLIAEKKTETKQAQVRNVGDKLLSLAEGLLKEDLTTALLLARSAFHHPVAYALPRFLYEVAKIDRAAADGLYLDALNAYAGKDMDSLLPLSAYPFAIDRLGQSPWQGMALTPPNFSPNPELQQKFVTALLLLGEKQLKAALEQPPTQGPSNRPSAPEKILTALLALESLYAVSDPSFMKRAAPLKELATTMLSARDQQRALSYSKLNPRVDSERSTTSPFDNILEQAEKIKEPAARDRLLVMGLQGAILYETADRLTSAAQKIDDPNTRRQFLDNVYFSLTLKAVRAGLLDEAAQLAERVDALDQRAVVMLEIATEALRKFNDKQRAGELLERVFKTAQTAPDTEAKARALLGVSYLYTTFDYLRASEVMNDAIRATNKLVEPELSATSLRRHIEGKALSLFMSHPMPGFNLENAFRELGPHDFEGTLSVARNLEDRHLRAAAIIALSAKCLETPPADTKDKPAPNQKKTGEAGKAKGAETKKKP